MRQLVSYKCLSQKKGKKNNSAIDNIEKDQITKLIQPTKKKTTKTKPKKEKDGKESATCQPAKP